MLHTVHTEHREPTEIGVVLAVISTFVILAGIAIAIHGMLLDENPVTLSGAATVIVGVIASVAFLSLWPEHHS